jgi:hypothetical protein
VDGRSGGSVKRKEVPESFKEGAIAEFYGQLWECSDRHAYEDSIQPTLV